MEGVVDARVARRGGERNVSVARFRERTDEPRPDCLHRQRWQCLPHNVLSGEPDVAHQRAHRRLSRLHGALRNGGAWRTERSPVPFPAGRRLLAHLLRLHGLGPKRSPYVQGQEHLGTLDSAALALPRRGYRLLQYAGQQDLRSPGQLHYPPQRAASLHGRHLEPAPPGAQPPHLAAYSLQRRRHAGDSLDREL